MPHDDGDPATAAEQPTTPPGPGGRAWRRRLSAEVWIVLGLSLGQSALYAVVRIIERTTRETALADQSVAINRPLAPRPNFDLTFQLLGIGFAILPVLLALYLLSANGRSAVRRIGFDLARPGRDLAVGAGLAALIGIPGLGVYAAGRALGITVEIQAAVLAPYWWAVPVLLLNAVKAAVLEEVIAVGYLSERLRELRWSVPAVIAASALLRGMYHLYQGYGMFVGNILMGVVFAWYYHRYRRVMPLVVAHFLVDLVAFVGYQYLPDDLLARLGVG